MRRQSRSKNRLERHDRLSRTQIIVSRQVSLCSRGPNTETLISNSANMSYACNMLVVTDSAPSKRLLGTVNGTAQMLASLMRAIGPTFASSFFALSVSHHLAGGKLVFYCMMGVSCVGAASALRLHHGGRASNEESAEE